MPTYGIQYLGIYERVSEDDPMIKGVVYENIRKYDSNIPEETYFELIKQLRENIDNSGYGTKTQFIEVNGNWVRVQWKQVGSPTIPIREIIIIITTVVGAVLTAYYLTQITSNIYKIISVLGTENVQWILQIITLFLILMLISPIMSAVTTTMREAFRRRE